MLSFILFIYSQSLNTGTTDASRTPNRDREKIYSLIETLTTNSSECNDLLENDFEKYCGNHDPEFKKRLAIKYMICEFSKDNRTQSYVYYDDQQFINSLSTEDLQVYTVFFNNIETICMHTLHNFQSVENLKNVYKTISAVNHSSSYINSYRNKVKELNERINNKFTEIDRQNDEKEMLLDNIMIMMKDVNVVISNITTTLGIYSTSFKAAKFYLKVIAASTVASIFLLPEIFKPILSLTAVALYIEYSFGAKEGFWMTLLRSAYLAGCCIVCIATFRVKLYLTRGLIGRRIK